MAFRAFHSDCKDWDYGSMASRWQLWDCGGFPMAGFEIVAGKWCTSKNQWIYNIKNMGIRQEVAFKQNSEVFRRLEEVANVATLTPQQRYDYEADLKMYRDTVNQIRGAHQEGREEEMKRSFRTMLAFGIPVEAIAEKYGISAAEVEWMAASNPR